MEFSSSHPRVLPYLCLTELWERFGFYIVQGLLVLYVSQHFGFTDSESYTLLGVFTALLYIAPLAGGYLANKLLGYQTAVIWGGCFFVVGYALLTLPHAKLFFYPALATIVVGNGLFKPNISSLLGTQYAANDPKRDSGFTLFYIGINIGALMAGLTSGYIKEWWGWKTCFALASIGLLLGIITFRSGLKYIKSDKKPLGTAFKLKFLACCLLAIIGLYFLLTVYSLADWLLPGTGIVLFVSLVLLTLQQQAEDRDRMFILNLLILASIVFWMLFFQLFSSANLFVDRLVDKNMLGIHLTPSLFWGSESIYIILLGPLFAWMWQKLGSSRYNPSSLMKFSLACLFAGLCFMTLGFSTFFPNAQGMIHPTWVFFAYLLLTIGELLLSPIGLSAVTQLAPQPLVGLMMGVWFVALGFGGMFSGVIAKKASIPDNVVALSAKLAIYQKAFFYYAYFAFIIAIILFFTLVIKKKLARK